MSKTEIFTVSHPLPSRKAYEALRRQIADFLARTQPASGTPFLSDHELARASGLARNTVRRSVDLLVKDGWIERRHGKGTFVGPRAALQSRRPAMTDDPARKAPRGPNASQQIIRLAVLLGYPAGGRTSWYSMGVLRGLEEAAVQERIVIELYNFGASAEHVRQRLDQSLPDVLACLSPHPQWAMLITETRARGIPVLLTGTRLSAIGLPVINEDGAAGAELAVRHLLDHGHRRIAFVQDTVPVPWAFDRFYGFVRAMQAAGLDPDDGLNVWVRQEDNQPDDGRLGRMLDRVRPTAVLLGSGGLIRFLGPALSKRGLRVPEDLSLISFDQAAQHTHWLPDKQVTIIALPLEEMGRLLARQAREAVEGRLKTQSIVLPCALQPGNTVQTCATQP